MADAITLPADPDLVRLVQALQCDRTEQRPHHVIYHSFTLGEATAIDQIIARLGLGGDFEEVNEWRDGWFRVIWRSDKHRSLVTYCEGDVTVDVSPDADAWDSHISECTEFYLRN